VTRLLAAVVVALALVSCARPSDCTVTVNTSAQCTLTAGTEGCHYSQVNDSCSQTGGNPVVTTTTTKISTKETKHK
jgi:hypothetical protein